MLAVPGDSSLVTFEKSQSLEVTLNQPFKFGVTFASSASFDLRLGAGATCYCTGAGCPTNCQNTTACYLDKWNGENPIWKSWEFLGQGHFVIKTDRHLLRPRNRVSGKRRSVSLGKNVRVLRLHRSLEFCWRLIFAFSKRDIYLKLFTKNPVMLILSSTLSIFFAHVF